MNAKYLFLDFLNLLFFLLLIGGFIAYFFYWGGLSAAQELLKFLIPLAVFGFLLIIKMHFKKKKKKKREREGNLEIILRLSFMDKTKADIITFGVPIILLFIPFLFSATVNLEHILQAVFAFLVLYFWNKYLFNQEDL